MNRTEILNAAKECICGKCEQDYGSPENSFRQVAELWNAYLGGKIVQPVDVPLMLVLLKIAQIQTGGGTDDNYVDIAGYAACAGEVATLGGNNE